MPRKEELPVHAVNRIRQKVQKDLEFSAEEREPVSDEEAVETTSGAKTAKSSWRKK